MRSRSRRRPCLSSWSRSPRLATSALSALVEQRVDPLLGVAGGRRDARVEVDVQAHRATLVGAEARQLPQVAPSSSSRHATPPLSVQSGAAIGSSAGTAAPRGCGSLGRTVAPRVSTIGHGTRRWQELVATVVEADVEMLVDVRRFPGSRRQPAVQPAGARRGAGERGDRLPARGRARRAAERRAGRGPVRVHPTAAFRSYAARMGSRAWQRARLRAGLACTMLPLCRDRALDAVPSAADRRRARRPRSRRRPPARARPPGVTPPLEARRGRQGWQALPVRRARVLTVRRVVRAPFRLLP